MALREQQSLDALTRHVDDEKQNRVREVRELPGDAEFGDEVVMRGELYKYLNSRWFKIMMEAVKNG